MEIGQLVADAFRRGPAGRDELISSARENGADEEALVLLDSSATAAIVSCAICGSISWMCRWAGAGPSGNG